MSSRISCLNAYWISGRSKDHWNSGPPLSSIVLHWKQIKIKIKIGDSSTSIVKFKEFFVIFFFNESRYPSATKIQKRIVFIFNFWLSSHYWWLKIKKIKTTRNRLILNWYQCNLYYRADTTSACYGSGLHWSV